MEYKNILVPFDGSKHAMGAVKAALGLIKGSDDSKLTILHVVSMSVAPTISESDPVLGSTPISTILTMQISTMIRSHRSATK